MRIWVVAVALIAAAQPALAKPGSHRLTARTYVDQSRVMAAPAAFARTDATDTPYVFGEPAFQYRSRQSFAAPDAPSFTGYAPAPRVRHAGRNTALDGAIARHAAANGLPVELVHRVVIRESRYNPAARNGPNLGLMQIQYRTARGVGYTGSPAGLMDAETNLTYAVRYLAGAYRAAGGNQSRAVAYYASGYHGRGVRQPAVRLARAEPAWGMQSEPVMMTDMTGASETRRSWRRYAR